MMLVKGIKIRLSVSKEQGHYGLCGCFRSLLAYPTLRRVTVKVGLAVGDWVADGWHVPKDVVADESF